MVQRYDADTVAAKKRLRDKRQGVKDRRRELDLLAFRSNQGGAPLGCAQQLGQGLRFFLKRVLVRIESKGCRRALLCHVTSVISGTNPRQVQYLEPSVAYRTGQDREALDSNPELPAVRAGAVSCRGVCLRRYRC